MRTVAVQCIISPTVRDGGGRHRMWTRLLYNMKEAVTEATY